MEGAGAETPVPSEPNVLSANDLWDMRKNVDAKINFNKNPQLVQDATLEDVRRGQRGALANLITKAAPESKQAMQDYSDLSEAAKLAEKRTHDKGMGIFALPRMLSLLTGGVLGDLHGGTLEGVAAAAGADALTRALTSTAAKTTYAKGLFNLGSGLKSLGDRIGPGGEGAAISPAGNSGYGPAEGGANQATENNAQNQGLHRNNILGFLPQGKYEAPPTPVKGYLPESGMTGGGYSVPTDIQGTVPIPKFLQKALPAQRQIQLPPSPMGALGQVPGIRTPHQQVAVTTEGMPVVKMEANRRAPKGLSY
jgi:hypothetical protein